MQIFGPVHIGEWLIKLSRVVARETHNGSVRGAKPT